jgi:hypothetical protein
VDGVGEADRGCGFAGAVVYAGEDGAAEPHVCYL